MDRELKCGAEVVSIAFKITGQDYLKVREAFFDGPVYFQIGLAFFLIQIQRKVGFVQLHILRACF